MTHLKVQKIFEMFDTDGRGALDQGKLASFVRAANPSVVFTELQMEAILCEVFEEYPQFVGGSGLSLEGLEQIYMDGIGNVDLDFATLGLSLETAPEVSCKSSQAEVIPVEPHKASKATQDHEAPVLDPSLLTVENMLGLDRQLSGAESIPEPSTAEHSRDKAQDLHKMPAISNSTDPDVAVAQTLYNNPTHTSQHSRRDSHGKFQLEELQLEEDETLQQTGEQERKGRPSTGSQRSERNSQTLDCSHQLKSRDLSLLPRQSQAESQTSVSDPSSARLAVNTSPEGLRPRTDASASHSLVSKQRLEDLDSSPPAPTPLRGSPSPQHSLHSTSSRTSAGAAVLPNNDLLSAKQSMPGQAVSPIARAVTPNGRKVAQLVQSLEVASPPGRARAPSPGPRASLEHATRRSIQEWGRRSNPQPGSDSRDKIHSRQQSQDFGALDWSPVQLAGSRSRASASTNQQQSSHARSLSQQFKPPSETAWVTTRRSRSRQSQSVQQQQQASLPAFKPDLQVELPTTSQGAIAEVPLKDRGSEAGSIASDHPTDHPAVSEPVASLQSYSPAERKNAKHNEPAALAHSIGRASGSGEGLGANFQSSDKAGKYAEMLHCHRVTNSRGSDVGSIIHAHQHGSLPHSSTTEEAGLDAALDEEADVFDEVSTPHGGIYKLPSAISIEARANSSSASWANQHSRVPSLAEEILEAAQMPPLKVFVPPAVCRLADDASALNRSPGSSERAEQEAEVGHESLDSLDIETQLDPQTLSTPVAMTAEEVGQEMRIALAGSHPSQQHCANLRARIDTFMNGRIAADMHIEMGQLLMKRQDVEEAIISFRAATQHAPSESCAFFRLGNALYVLERYSESEHAFKEALKAAQMPKENKLVMKIHTNLGIALEAQGLLLSACNHYREAASMSSSHHRVLKLLGGALYALGDLPAARDALQKSLTLNPRYSDGYCDLGCTYCALGEADAARKAFKSALRHDAGHAEALFNLGNLERQSGHYEAAMECYRAVLSVQPHHWRTLLNSAVALAGLRQPEKAQAALKKALQISGQGEAVAEEVRQLKKLARHGASMAQLSKVSSAISEKTAAALPSPLRPTPKKLFHGQPVFERPPSGHSSVQKLGRSKAPAARVNLPLLQSLAPLTDLSTASLLDVLHSQPKASISTIEMEELLRELLPAMPAKRFAGLVRSISRSLLPHMEKADLYSSSPGVNLTLFLVLGIAMSDESWENRATAIFDVLAQGSSRVSFDAVQASVNFLQDCFGSPDTQHQPMELIAATSLEHPEELMLLLAEPLTGVEALPDLPSIALGRSL